MRYAQKQPKSNFKPHAINRSIPPLSSLKKAQMNPDPRLAEEADVPSGHSLKSINISKMSPFAAQPKLKVNSPGGKYEQEADSIAKTVMQMPEEDLRLSKGLEPHANTVQRQIPENEADELIQPKQIANHTPQITPEHETGIDSLKGRGNPLPNSTRSFFEPRFNHDFSQIRIHNNPQAHSLANSLSAKAFTVGSNIVFNQGEYRPDSKSGRQLIAHELTHSIQQGGNTRNGLILNRIPILDAHNKFTEMEFEIGKEITSAFAWKAKQLTADGNLSNKDIRRLRLKEIIRLGTLEDGPRMFIAGLLDATNITKLQGFRIRKGSKIRFPFSTITQARMNQVKDLDRGTLPGKITREYKSAFGALTSGDFKEMQKHLDAAERIALKETTKKLKPYNKQSARLIKFCTSNKINLVRVLEAMYAAASDNNNADWLLAANMYAIASEAGHPMANDIHQGRIKADAVYQQVFKKYQLPPNTIAIYVSHANVMGAKGDTIYANPNLNILKIFDRSVVIHELTHAKDDKAESTTRAPKDERILGMEEKAFKAQALYILKQIKQITNAKEKNKAVKKLIKSIKKDYIQQLSIMLMARKEKPTYNQELADIFTKRPFKLTPAKINILLSKTVPFYENLLRTKILTVYRITPATTGQLEGLAGESMINWIFRL